MPCEHDVIEWGELVDSVGDRDGGYHAFRGSCESCGVTMKGFGNTPEPSSIYEIEEADVLG